MTIQQRLKARPLLLSRRRMILATTIWTFLLILLRMLTIRANDLVSLRGFQAVRLGLVILIRHTALVMLAERWILRLIKLSPQAVQILEVMTQILRLLVCQ